MDSNVSSKNGGIITELYFKPTDGHENLHYKTSHLEHMKSSTEYSQALKAE